MKVISQIEIDSIIATIDKYNSGDIDKKLATLSKKQPVLFTYLLTISELYDDDMKEDIFYIGFVILECMLQSEEIEMIKQEEIDNNEQKNINSFSLLDDQDYNEILLMLENIIENYNQQFLLRFVVDEIFAEEEEGGYFYEPDDIPVITAYLKTLIDCLDI